MCFLRGVRSAMPFCCFVEINGIVSLPPSIKIKHDFIETLLLPPSFSFRDHRLRCLIVYSFFVELRRRWRDDGGTRIWECLQNHSRLVTEAWRPLCQTITISAGRGLMIAGHRLIPAALPPLAGD